MTEGKPKARDQTLILTKIILEICLAVTGNLTITIGCRVGVISIFHAVFYTNRLIQLLI